MLATGFQNRRRGRLLFVTMMLLAAPAAIADGPAQHRHVDSSEAAAPASAKESAFHSEINAAMDKMMADMAVMPTGDIDRDFVEMMVPHHQGAIDMALAVLRFGKNEQIRRLAQEIIVTQQQEIAVMRLAIGDPLPDSVASPTQRPSASSDAMRQHHSTK